MKQIFLFLITFLVSYSNLFAENNVNISLSESEVNTWDNFTMSIDISTDSQDNIELLGINWIENFDIIWRQEGSKNINLNGDITITHNLNLELISSNSWVYILWPVSIKFWNETISSDSISITVNEFIIPSLNNNSTDIISKEWNSNKLIELKEEENNKIDSNNKKKLNIIDNIHPVKKFVMNFNTFEYIGVLCFWLFIIFISIFYLFLIKILNHKKIYERNKQTELDNLEKRKQEIKNIYNELLTLSDKAEKYSQEQFYTELNNLFRRFFLYIGIDKADKKTLSELNKNNIDKKILDIFTTSYIYEFSTKVDSLSERKQIVMNFMIFLKK